MVVGLLFVLACGGVLWGAIMFSEKATERTLLPRVLMGGYILRLVIQFFIRDIPFFTHAVGGDSWEYEFYGQTISKVWQMGGIHFVEADEVQRLGATTLPQNIFALIIYLNDGETCRLGCTAVVALAAGLATLNIYFLSVQFGAEKRQALLVASIIYFQPAVLFYTSDMYKDGLVLCLGLGVLGSALRLAYKLSLLHVVIGLVSIVLLWYVRFYLIFITLAPLVAGVMGLGGKRPLRTLGAGMALALGVILVATYTDIFDLATERAGSTFETATSQGVITANYRDGTGSGVQFDDGGSPTGALPAKLAYTLFSPFLWAGGSIGFHVGKLDGLLWYYILYRAIRAMKKTDTRLLVMLATFAVPCTVVYAMTMANVGLIVRQRLIIVAATAILAGTYRPNKGDARFVARPVFRRRAPGRVPSSDAEAA
jgi:hypothetical protein